MELPTASRYYSMRNLVRVLGRERAWRAIASVVTVRAIGKPLAGLVLRPRAAMANLAVNLLAVVDAVRGRMGRRERFPSVCGLSTSGMVPGRGRRRPRRRTGPRVGPGAGP